MESSEQAEIGSLRELLASHKELLAQVSSERDACEAQYKDAPVLYGHRGADGWYFYPRARPAQGDTHRCRAVGIEELKQ